jgi:hypothetical protein
VRSFHLMLKNCFPLLLLHHKEADCRPFFILQKDKYSVLLQFLNQAINSSQSLCFRTDNNLFFMCANVSTISIQSTYGSSNLTFIYTNIFAINLFCNLMCFQFVLVCGLFYHQWWLKVAIFSCSVINGNNSLNAIKSF